MRLSNRSRRALPPRNPIRRMDDRMRKLLPLLVLVAVAPSPFVRGAELLPADRPIEAAIDHYIDQQLRMRDVHPAPQADESVLLRRAMLE